MLNHIAVLLRGHVRTWKIIYPYVFDFYESIARNVDYYFITWQGSQATTNLYGTFKGRVLSGCVFLQPNTDFASDSYKSSSYLAYMLLPYKHAREQHITYDMVFDSRPDVIPILRKNKFLFPAEENTLYTTSFDLHINQRTNFYDVAVQDWFFACSSKVYDKMAERFIVHNDQGVQVTIRDFAERNGINVNSLSWARAFMARPNITDIIKDGILDYDRLNQSISEWMLYDSDKKLEYIFRNGIVKTDYITGSQTCSI